MSFRFVRFTTLFAVASVPASTTPAQSPPSTASQDSLHPKNFVEIFEISRRGDSRTLFRPRSRPECLANPSHCDRSIAEVDVNSKIAINIDRQFLNEIRFAGSFGIKGTLHTAGSFRQIEIPGYSVIGKENETIAVSVGAISGILSAVAQLDTAGRALQESLKAARKAARDSVISLSATRNANMLETRQIIDRLRREIRAAGDSITVAENQRRMLEAQQDSITPLDTTSIRGLTEQLSLKRTRLAAQQDSLNDRLTALRVDSIRIDDEADKIYVVRARGIIRTNTPVRVAIRMFTNPGNEQLIRLLSEQMGRLPEAYIGLARSADSLWEKIMLPDNDVITAAKAAQIAGEIDGLVAALAGLPSKTLDAKTFHQRALAVMKDAEFNLQQIGAKAGDRIVISLTDSIAGQSGSTRVFEVHLLVREFGIIRNITDAVLIMNLGSGIGRQQQRAEIDAAQLLANSTQVARTLSYPVALRGAPAAGVTLSWTYAPRLYDERSKIPNVIRAVAHWLQPGLGINAAVPGVSQKTITLTPQTTNDTPPVEETRSSELTYTAGVIVTVFDNAVSWSWGRNLNGDRNRRYTAMGISFLAATEKAKELFKKYGQ